jgi:hypothetical protein
MNGKYKVLFLFCQCPIAEEHGPLFINSWIVGMIQRFLMISQSLAPTMFRCFIVEPMGEVLLTDSLPLVSAAQDTAANQSAGRGVVPAVHGVVSILPIISARVFPLLPSRSMASSRSTALSSELASLLDPTSCWAYNTQYILPYLRRLKAEHTGKKKLIPDHLAMMQVYGTRSKSAFLTVEGAYGIQAGLAPRMPRTNGRSALDG